MGRETTDGPPERGQREALPSRRTPFEARATIRAFLGRVRGLLYRHDGVRAGLWAITAVLVVAVALPFAGLALVGSQTTAATLVGLGVAIASAALIGAIVAGAVMPRRRYGDDADVARWIGRRSPIVAPEVGTDEASERRLTSLGGDLLSCVQLDRQPDDRRGTPSPQLVGALHVATARRIADVDPAALFARRSITRARVAVAVALVANVVALAAARGSLADGWRRLLAAPERPFGGAAMSTVPLVGDVELTLEYPAYTGRPPSVLPSSSGDFQALPGTRVAIRTRALVPAASARIVIEPEGGGAIEYLPVVVDDDILRVEWTVAVGGRYRFALTDPHGATSVEATPHQIELEIDHAPSVELIAPADELDVTNLRRVELAYVVEDDHGVAAIELVWNAAKDTGRRPIAFDGEHARAQGKFVWDMAEIPLPPGAEVHYWLEVKDNDTVDGPNVGRSREFRLKVFSARERHEQHLARQQEVAEKMLGVLGSRLPMMAPRPEGDDPAARLDIHRQSEDLVAQLGSLVAAYEKDPHAATSMREALDAMRTRLDRLLGAEKKIVDRLPRVAAKGLGNRFSTTDHRLVGELEDDVLAVIDWLERERLEGLLDLSDEITNHQKRLEELMAEYGRTGDPRLKAEIERELRALHGLLDQLDRQRAGVAEDVLDRFVNADAMKDRAYDGCLDEVQALFAKGDIAAAKAKLEACRVGLDQAMAGMEAALAGLRGERFGDEQRLLDEVMDELADLARDQEDIAAEANRIFDDYAEKADDLARDNGRDAQKKTAGLLDKLRKRLDDVPDSGLTPFAEEELDIVRRRVDDVARMIGDGDVAEAAAMARQAKGSLDTVTVELEAALDDDPRGRFAKATGDALDAVEKVHPPLDELIDELDDLAPDPDQILDRDDKAALDRLRRRQAMNHERAKKLGDKSQQRAGELPGDAGPELSRRLGEAGGRMDSAQKKMKAHDPGGARQDARSAADLLARARQQARGAARQQQQGAGVDDEPIRIPGADAYRAPEKFREELLEAMKRRAPDGFDEQVRRYYEELIR